MAYVTLLKHETFFKTNRQFLLLGIIAALIAPALVLTRTVYKAPVVDFDIPEELLLQAQASPILEESFNFWQLGVFIYSIGVAVMLFLFSKKLIQIFSFLKNTQQKTSNGYHYVQIDGLEAPFSFFNYIVLDAQAHNEEELEMIILHEQAHASQRHSLDMFLVQFVLIIQWFNPLAWLYKNAVVQNLEYLADATTASQIENRKNYQLALVKVAAPQFVPALAHSFYQSFIKKRIVMLNKQSSSEFRKWKLLLIVPILGAFMWSFNVKEEVKFKTEPLSASEVKESENDPDPLPSQTENPNKTNLPEILEDEIKQPVAKTEQTSPKAFKKVITKSATKNELDALAEELKTKYNVEFKYSRLDYNDSGLLTSIKLSVKDKSTGNQASSTYSSDKYINDITIYRTEEGTFGVVSASNSVIQGTGKTKIYAEETVDRVREMEARMQKRRAELELRKEEIQVEMELRKAQLEAEREIRMQEIEAELEIRKAEMEIRRVEMQKRIHKKPDSLSFLIGRDKNAYQGSHNKRGIGQTSSFAIRGISEKSDNQPLVIVDGKEMNDALDSLNPEDIESFSILKDASFTAVYKEKGKNGVILITTKEKKD